MTQWIYCKFLHTPVEPLAAMSQIFNTHSPSPMRRDCMRDQKRAPGNSGPQCCSTSVPSQPMSPAAAAQTPAEQRKRWSLGFDVDNVTGLTSWDIWLGPIAFQKMWKVCSGSTIPCPKPLGSCVKDSEFIFLGRNGMQCRYLTLCNSIHRGPGHCPISKH